MSNVLHKTKSLGLHCVSFGASPSVVLHRKSRTTTLYSLLYLRDGGHGEYYLELARGDSVLACSTDFNESGALVIFQPKGGAGQHQRAQAVLVDPTVELGWRRFELAMVAVC
jgi:hypothetical protein